MDRLIEERDPLSFAISVSDGSSNSGSMSERALLLFGFGAKAEREPGMLDFFAWRATSSRWIAASCCLRKNSFCWLERDSFTSDEIF